MGDVTVDIAYEPIKKVVVHEIYRYKDKDDLMKRVIRPNGPMQLFWCDGILFIFVVSDSDEAKADYLKGVFHWDVFAYTEMREFLDIIEYDDNYVRGVKVAVVDYSTFPIFKDFIKWLKARDGV